MDTAKLNLWSGKSKRRGVSGRAWCLCVELCAELGIAKTCSPQPLWWAWHYPAWETWCSSQSGSGQVLYPNRGSQFAGNAQCPCSDISPSSFSCRGICKQILAQATNQPVHSDFALHLLSCLRCVFLFLLLQHSVSHGWQCSFLSSWSRWWCSPDIAICLFVNGDLFFYPSAAFYFRV